MGDHTQCNPCPECDHGHINYEVANAKVMGEHPGYDISCWYCGWQGRISQDRFSGATYYDATQETFEVEPSKLAEMAVTELQEQA